MTEKEKEALKILKKHISGYRGNIKQTDAVAAILEFHQAKSKEEAEDVVIKIIEAVSSEYRGAVELDEWYGLGEIIETIRSTAFGKEEEG